MGDFGPTTGGTVTGSRQDLKRELSSILNENLGFKEWPRGRQRHLFWCPTMDPSILGTGEGTGVECGFSLWEIPEMT
jgi:hypothetical protein